MKKTIICVVILLVLLAIGIAISVNIVNNMFCYEVSHKGVYPVNPYCEKCRGRDGDIQHECTNPNGEEKYCRVCGKIVSNNIWR